MQERFYIAALPVLTCQLHQIIDQVQLIPCYPEIRLPFHTTLYYLDQITDQQKAAVVQWLSSLAIPAIEATVSKVDCFSRDDVAHTYFVRLQSLQLVDLNAQMEKEFSKIHTDQFSFLPHMSLFFPKLALSHQQTEALNNYFNNITKIEYQGIYLGSEVDNVTIIHYLKPSEEDGNKRISSSSR